MPTHSVTHRCSSVFKKTEHQRHSFGDAAAGTDRILLVQFKPVYWAEYTRMAFSTELLLAGHVWRVSVMLARQCQFTAKCE